MSNLTVSDIITRARNRYNAKDDDFYSDEELRDLIYDAQGILAKEGWVIENTFTTPSIADTRSYAYPTTTLAIKEVRHDYNLVGKTTLNYDPKTSAEDPTGKPRSYAIWEDAIILFPTPDTDGSLDLSGERVNYIDVKVFKYPNDLTSNASPIEVPEEYKEDLVYYCLMWMALKDQNTTLSDRYQLLWDKAVLRAKKQRRKRLRGDRMASVQDTYFGYAKSPNVEDRFTYYGGY